MPPSTTNQAKAGSRAIGTSKPEPNRPDLSLVIRCATNLSKVGDEIPIQFIISNRGAADYKYANRTYDRGGRMPEYRLTAKLASGESVPDPRQHFRASMMGGLFQYDVLHPGESFTKVIPLNLWALIQEPGQYEITGTYVTGTYEANPGSASSDPIRITVLPRTMEEMHDYIRGLTNRVAGRLADLAAYQAGHPGGLTPGLADAELRSAMMSLMYTGSAEGIPALLRILFESGDSFWATAALEDYVPHTDATRKALLEAAARHGLNSSLGNVLQAYDFDQQEMKPVLERALAADYPDEWPAGVWLALRYYDDTLTTRLIAIANDSNARWDTRSVALRALTYHRTDAGVKAIKALLKHPAPDMLNPLAETIENGYAHRDMIPTGRPLQPEDFSAEDLRPLIEQLLVSTNQALQLQLQGALLAKQFGSDDLTAQLVALTTNSSPYVRYQAICALALNRTDKGVKTLKALLNSSDPQISNTAEAAIRSAYTARGDARGRPLRTDDFDAKYREPEATPPK